MNRRGWHGTLLVLGVTAALSAEAAVTDINAPVVQAINSDRAGRSRLFTEMGLQGIGQEWEVKAVKITKLANTDVKISAPAPVYQSVTSRQIVNCEPTATSQSVTLSKEVENSTAVSKSSTFEVGVSATLSFSSAFSPVSGSVTASTSYSTTNASEQRDTNRETISDTTQVNFNDAGGRITVLQALRVDAKGVPWSASFTPLDAQDVEVTVGGIGQVCFFKGRNYTEARECFPANGQQFMPRSPFQSVLVLPGADLQAFVAMQGWKHFGSIEHDAREPLKFASLMKVNSVQHTRAIAWAALKKYVPEPQRTFMLTGTMDIDKTTALGKRTINFAMTTDQVKAICSMAPDVQPAPGSGYSAAAASRIQGVPTTRKGVVARDLTPAELAGFLRTAQPMQ